MDAILDLVEAIITKITVFFVKQVGVVRINNIVTLTYADRTVLTKQVNEIIFSFKIATVARRVIKIQLADLVRYPRWVRDVVHTDIVTKYPHEGDILIKGHAHAFPGQAPASQQGG